MTLIELAENEYQTKLLSSLPFRVFLWIADADSHVEIEEVEVFLKMLKRLRWCRSFRAKELLPHTLERYSEFWKSFQSQKIKNDLHRIQEGVQFLSNRLPPTEAKHLFDDFYRLARSVAKASGGLMGIGSISPEEQCALRQLSIVLDCQLMSSQISRNASDPVISKLMDSSTSRKDLQEAQETLVISLPFRVFIWIAEANLTPDSKEVEHFVKTIADHQVCQSVFLQELFRKTHENYLELWNSYEKGDIKKDLNGIYEAVRILNHHLTSPEIETLVKDLEALAQSLSHASGIMGIGVGGMKEHKALKQLENALEYSLILDAPLWEDVGVFASSPSTVPLKIKGKSIEILPPLAPILSEPVKQWTQGGIRIRCVEILQTTHDVKTFRFVADPACLFDHKPGQFLTLSLDIDNKKVSRCYTISSTPSRPHTLEITVKRVEGGLVSNWLHDHLKIGNELNARGPSGSFNCVDHPAPKMLMLSAGSGITPLMAMARWICDMSKGWDVVFLHIAKSPMDVIFRKELELMQSMYDNFHLFISLTRSKPLEHWGDLMGQFNTALLQTVALDYRERSVYVCGPEGMMKACLETFESLDFPMENYYQESFGGVVEAPTIKSKEKVVSLTLPKQEQGSKTVFFSQSEQEVECPSETTILEIAENSGVNIPHACRAGVCGSCKALKTEGEVVMECQDGLELEEKEDGYILTCVSYPKGRVVVEV